MIGFPTYHWLECSYTCSCYFQTGLLWYAICGTTLENCLETLIGSKLGYQVSVWRKPHREQRTQVLQQLQLLCGCFWSRVGKACIESFSSNKENSYVEADFYMPIFLSTSTYCCCRDFPPYLAIIYLFQTFVYHISKPLQAVYNYYILAKVPVYEWVK